MNGPVDIKDGTYTIEKKDGSFKKDLNGKWQDVNCAIDVPAQGAIVEVKKNVALRSVDKYQKVEDISVSEVLNLDITGTVKDDKVV